MKGGEDGAIERIMGLASNKRRAQGIEAMAFMEAY
jgi:hypothetical protein